MILMIRARARAFKFFSKKKKQPTARARNRIETPSSERTQPNDRVDADDEPSRTRASSSSSTASSIATRADRNDRGIFSTVHPIALNRRVPSVGTNAHDGTNGTRPTTPFALAFALAFAHALVRPSVARIRRPSVRRARRETEPSSVRWFKIRVVVRLPSSSSLPSSVVPGMRRMPNRESGLSNPPRASLPSSSSVVASSSSPSSSSSPEHAPRRIKPTQTPVRARMRTTTSRAGWTNR